MTYIEKIEDGGELFTFAISQLLHEVRDERVPVTDEIIAAIERLDTCDVRAAELVDAIGVFAGVKPVGLIGELADEDYDQTKDLVKALGLICEEDGYGSMTISRHQELIDEMNDTLATKALHNNTIESYAENHEVEYKLGALFGYPKKSTAHFLERFEHYKTHGELLPIPRLPKEMGNIRYFQMMVLSPELSEEEVTEYIQPLHDAVKVITPNLYKRFVDEKAATLSRSDQ